MEWKGEFLVYSIVNDTLVRVFDEETNADLGFDAFTPALNNGVMTILKQGLIHMHTPQPHPLCASCGKE